MMHKKGGWLQERGDKTEKMNKSRHQVLSLAFFMHNYYLLLLSLALSFPLPFLSFSCEERRQSSTVERIGIFCQETMKQKQTNNAHVECTIEASCSHATV